MATFKDMSIEQIQKEVAAKREALRAFRFGAAGSRSKNVKEGKNLRKEIARLLTELNSRKVAQ
jgi:ribosomal protein L29